MGFDVGAPRRRRNSRTLDPASPGPGRAGGGVGVGARRRPPRRPWLCLAYLGFGLRPVRAARRRPAALPDRRPSGRALPPPTRPLARWAATAGPGIPDGCAARPTGRQAV